jgi:hypothetical protein
VGNYGSEGETRCRMSRRKRTATTLEFVAAIFGRKLAIEREFQCKIDAASRSHCGECFKSRIA